MKPYMNNEELIDELVIHKNINRETIPENIFKEDIQHLYRRIKD